jgi:hypothetical protein
MPEQSLESFPNPASDELTIVLPEDHTLFGGDLIYTITDLSGKVVRKSSLVSDLTGERRMLSVPIADFSSGMYMISMSDGKRLYSTKFVKQ